MATTKHYVFKQLEESKLLPSRVVCVACSSKRDLLACGLANGEVVLNRAGCTWHRVWSLPSVSEGVVPHSLAFRPDSKVLAVGYSDGSLSLCTMEKSSVFHTHELGATVTSLTWLEVAEHACTSSSQPPIFDFLYCDLQNMFLPKLPANPSKSTGFFDTSKKEDYVDDAKGLKGQEQCLNLLVAGTRTGVVAFYGYGLLKFGVLNFENNVSVHHIYPHEDMRMISVLVVNGDSSLVSAYHLDVTQLQSQRKNIKILSFQYGYCLHLLEYLQSTLKTMVEQWEDGLSLLERYLTKAAIEMRECSVSATPSVCDDLLNLWVLGECSEQLLLCVQHNLCDKVVRKLAQATESSYNNLLKLVLRYLILVSHALFYRLADLSALCKLPEGITTAGIIHAQVVRAQSYLAGFMMKTSELQEVIETSQKVFKAFFKFLTTWSLKLSSDVSTPEYFRMSEEEIILVSDFLQEQAEKEKSLTLDDLKKRNLSFDRVKQYLKSSDLTNPSKTSGHPWTKLLSELVNLQHEPLFYQNYPHKSLIQLHKMFVGDMKEIFDQPLKQFSRRADEIIRNGVPMHYMNYLQPQPLGGFEEDRAARSELTGSKALIARQCLVKDVMYRLLLHNHSSGHSSLLFTKQSISPETNSLQALRISCVNEDVGEGLSSAVESRFDDVDFFFHHQSICQSICALLTKRECVDASSQEGSGDADNMDTGDVLSGNQAYVQWLYMIPLSSLTCHMGHVDERASASTLCESQEMATVHMESLSGITTHQIENMPAARLAVNSDRNVISVLHATERKFRVFEFGELENDADDTETDVIADITDSSTADHIEDM